MEEAVSKQRLRGNRASRTPHKAASPSLGLPRRERGKPRKGKEEQKAFFEKEMRAKSERKPPTKRSAGCPRVARSVQEEASSCSLCLPVLWDKWAAFFPLVIPGVIRGHASFLLLFPSGGPEGFWLDFWEGELRTFKCSLIFFFPRSDCTNSTTTDVKLTGLFFPASSLAPLLWMGTIHSHVLGGRPSPVQQINECAESTFRSSRRAAG